MTPHEILKTKIPEIERKLEYHFKDPNLLFLAFVHRSYVNEFKQVSEHNERLEFLGDAVLGLIVSEHLFRNFPNIPEGKLSALRSRLVEASSCMEYVKKLTMNLYLLLGKGERTNDGKGRESILADLFEAIIGAIFLDGGLDAVRIFFFGHFLDDIEGRLNNPESNWKAILQDYCQKKYQKTPVYEVLEETGPDHHKAFRIAVLTNDSISGIGEGMSKKEAQQKAAFDALQKIDPATYRQDPKN